MIVIVKPGGFDNATTKASGYEIPVLDPVNHKLIDHLAAEGGPPIYTLTPDEARSVLLGAQSGAVRKPPAQVKDLNVESGRGTLRLRTIRPDRAMDRGP